MESYAPILIFAAVAIAFPVITLLFTPLIRSRRPGDLVKLEPYECGIPARTFAFDHRVSVRYFLIAVVFVVFDVETVFIFPWAITHRSDLGWFGFVEMGIFLAILFVAYIYALKRKALDWV